MRERIRIENSGEATLQVRVAKVGSEETLYVESGEDVDLKRFFHAEFSSPEDTRTEFAVQNTIDGVRVEIFIAHGHSVAKARSIYPGRERVFDLEPEERLLTVPVAY